MIALHLSVFSVPCADRWSAFWLLGLSPFAVAFSQLYAVQTGLSAHTDTDDWNDWHE